MSSRVKLDRVSYDRWEDRKSEIITLFLLSNRYVRIINVIEKIKT